MIHSQKHSTKWLAGSTYAIAVFSLFLAPRLEALANTAAIQKTAGDRKVSKVDFQTLADKAELARIRGDARRVANLYQEALSAGESSKASDKELFDICIQASDALIAMGSFVPRGYSLDFDRMVTPKERRERVLSAGPFLEKAVQLTQKQEELKNYQAGVLQKLSEIAYAKGDFASEERLLLESIEALTADSVPSKGGLLLDANVKLAEIEIRKGHLEQAKDRLVAATQIKQDDFHFSNWKLAELYVKMGNPQLAEKPYAEAVSTLREDNNKYYLVQILPEWAATLRTLGKSDEADRVEEWLEGILNADPNLRFVKSQPALGSWGHIFPFPDVPSPKAGQSPGNPPIAGGTPAK